MWPTHTPSRTSSSVRRAPSRPPSVQGHIRLSLAAETPLLRALAGRPLPPVAGYDATSAQPTAQVGVQTPSGAPLLASWQYGLGRVVAWTADAGRGTGEWAGAWGAARLPAF